MASATSATSATRADEALRLQIHSPEVVRRTFDPRLPPADLPPMAPDERALTHAEFRIAVGVDTSGARPRRQGEEYRATVTVTGVEVETWLRVTLWLPHDASAQLVAHEEGHQALVERLYAEGEVHLQSAAAGWIEQELIGTGPSADAAREAAPRPVIEALTAGWIERTHGAAEVLGEAYDGATDHGRLAEPSAPAAVDRVLASRTTQAPVVDAAAATP